MSILGCILVGLIIGATATILVIAIEAVVMIATVYHNNKRLKGDDDYDWH